MRNIDNEYHWFWASQYHFYCFRKLQLAGSDLNPLTKIGLFASVTIYAGMHFEIQYSLSKSFMSSVDETYEFFVHF